MMDLLNSVSDRLLGMLAPKAEAAAASCAPGYQCQYFGTHSRLIRVLANCETQYVCGDCC